VGAGAIQLQHIWAFTEADEAAGLLLRLPGLCTPEVTGFVSTIAEQLDDLHVPLLFHV
jgi:hypothetical protein